MLGIEAVIESVGGAASQRWVRDKKSYRSIGQANQDWAQAFLCVIRERMSMGVALKSAPRKKCAVCGAEFTSRNKLFRHLRSNGHQVFSPKHWVGWRLLESVARGDIAMAEAVLGCCSTVVNSPSLETGHGAYELAEVLAWSGHWDPALRVLELLAAAGVRPSSKYLWNNNSLLQQWGLPATPSELQGGLISVARAEGDTEMVYRLLGLPQGPRRQCAHCFDIDILCDSNSWTETPNCGCYVCTPAISQWVAAQVENGATADDLTCVSCGGKLLYATAMKLASPEVALALEQQSVERVLATMDDFVWCPKCPSGGVAGHLSSKCDAVQCINEKCAVKFCRHCKVLARHHRLEGRWLTCEEADALGKAQAEEASEAFLQAKTKACPNCKARVIHDGGCSHMQCRVCKFQFCWICLRKYTGSYVFDLNGACHCAND